MTKMERAGPGSPAQVASRERNFRVFKLRGLYAMLRQLTGERRVEAQACVDLELMLLGAETETARRRAADAKNAKTVAAEAALDEYF